MSGASRAPLPSEAFPYTPPRRIRVDGQRQRRERQARAHLQRLGIGGMVRYEFAPVEESTLQKDPTSIRQKVWLLDLHRRRTERSKPNSRHSKTVRTGRGTRQSRDRKRGKCKVELLPNGALTCSHPGWHFGVECWHIRKIKATLGMGGGPYSSARRRPPTRWLFESGPAEETRRCNARVEAVTRVPVMLAELCRLHVPLPKRSGRTGLSARAAVYSLGIKVFANCSYARLLGTIGREDNFLALASNWQEHTPTVQTFCRRFGDEELGAYIERMIAATARPGAKLDRTLIIDSDNIPTIMSANSRNDKFGGVPPTWRTVATMVKRHFGFGDVTGLTGATDITLDEGLGSGDGPHFGSIARKARAIFEEAKNAAGDKAYSLRRNFTDAEGLGFDLYVPERANEKRLSARKPWPKGAQRMARLQRDDPRRFHQVYRMRSKGESLPSSSKRRYPFLRLRSRRTDPIPQYPLGLSFAKDENDYDLAISKLDQVTIAAIMAAAQTAVGCARLNEALMTILLENLYRLVTLEHLFNQRVEFNDPNFAFEGVRLVCETDVQVKVNESTRPLDNLRQE
jgi:hypothetical protein